MTKVRAIAAIVAPLLLSGCQSSPTCADIIVYDALGANFAEVYHPQDETVYIVPKDAEMDASTSSEIGGSLVIGKAGGAVWLDWPLGFAISDHSKFYTPKMTCETITQGGDATKTTCVGKEDGQVWLTFIADKDGVYEYKRHVDEFQSTMRRRGRCGLTLQSLLKMEADYATGGGNLGAAAPARKAL